MIEIFIVSCGAARIEDYLVLMRNIFIGIENNEETKRNQLVSNFNLIEYNAIHCISHLRIRDISMYLSYVYL